ncbi:MAG: efflux RND transporter periplasmic adaptor subunit [Roseibium sp.]|uniref:efflux RND transporter periplasmic adaptor subunit n=1 Tax=Roseibium sp. TaxID=1936156 RepID=UPI0026058E2D|nr:efflux RND transporter periplasmic adaptor subunit [Roseibium sp.]MCV0425600.1 efflux RND transporter periplasmic adaptor subunit [Roseibium sp.]
MNRGLALILALAGAFALGIWVSSSGLIGSDSKQARISALSETGQQGDAPEEAFPTNAVFVTTADVALTPPRSRIQSIGTGKAVRSVHVTADVAGTVESIHVQPNTDVRAGDPIVTLERETQEILLGSAKAEFEKQNASFARYETLLSQHSNAVSQAQVDEARAALAVAQAQVAEAQYEYDRRIIRAPFAGRINLNDLTVGSYLPQGAEIVTLVDASSLLVEFTVPETSIAQIRTGVPVRLSTPALQGRFFDGEIESFDSSIDEEFRTVRVRAEVQNPQNLLVPGMTFSVSLASSDAPLPTVPAVSILWNQNGAYVWRLGNENKPERVEVVLRHRQSDNVWVEADLNEGDQVVKDGAFKVSQGAEIAVEIAGTDKGRIDG